MVLSIFSDPVITVLGVSIKRVRGLSGGDPFGRTVVTVIIASGGVSPRRITRRELVRSGPSVGTPTSVFI